MAKDKSSPRITIDKMERAIKNTGFMTWWDREGKGFNCDRHTMAAIAWVNGEYVAKKQVKDACCVLSRDEKTLQWKFECGKEVCDDDCDYVFEFNYCPFCGKMIEYDEQAVVIAQGYGL